MTPAGALLAAYDRQIRAGITTAEIVGGRADRSGPLIRKIYPGERALVTYCDLAGLTGLGLLPAATTIPLIWSPPAGQAGTQPERSADA